MTNWRIAAAEPGRNLACALGVPVATVLDEWQSLLRRTDSIARQFTTVFETHLWPNLDARSASLADITAVLEQLAPLAQQVTALALEAGLQEAASRFVAIHVPETQLRR